MQRLNIRLNIFIYRVDKEKMTKSIRNQNKNKLKREKKKISLESSDGEHDSKHIKLESNVDV